jgi:hypothetical protein
VNPSESHQIQAEEEGKDEEVLPAEHAELTEKDTEGKGEDGPSEPVRPNPSESGGSVESITDELTRLRQEHATFRAEKGVQAKPPASRKS